MTLYERFEKISDIETSTSTRRRLLARAAKYSLGFAFVVAGLSHTDEAAAGDGCCVLAYQNQCPHCTGQGYDCGTGCTRWAWYCVQSNGWVWICGECYSGGGCQGCSCGTVAMSRGTRGLPRRWTGG